MEIKIIITKQKHLFNNGEYLVAYIKLNNEFFNEIIPEQGVADIKQLLECINDSLNRDVDLLEKSLNNEYIPIIYCYKCNGSGLINEPNKPEKHECEFCDGTGKNNAPNLKAELEERDKGLKYCHKRMGEAFSEIRELQSKLQKVKEEKSELENKIQMLYEVAKHYNK